MKRKYTLIIGILLLTISLSILFFFSSKSKTKNDKILEDISFNSKLQFSQQYNSEKTTISFYKGNYKLKTVDLLSHSPFPFSQDRIENKINNIITYKAEKKDGKNFNVNSSINKISLIITPIINKNNTHFSNKIIVNYEYNLYSKSEEYIGTTHRSLIFSNNGEFLKSITISEDNRDDDYVTVLATDGIYIVYSVITYKNAKDEDGGDVMYYVDNKGNKALLNDIIKEDGFVISEGTVFKFLNEGILRFGVRLEKEMYKSYSISLNLKDNKINLLNI